MSEDGSPDRDDQNSQEGQAPWPDLLARLGQAAEALQRQEGFRAPEMLAAQPGVDASWSWSSGLKESWAAVNLWREHCAAMPPRTQSLVTALHMLLADLLLSATPARNQIGLTPAQVWQAGALADRLNLYYRMALAGPLPVGNAQETPGAAALLEEEDVRTSMARRWEAELMPMAVALVLSEARLVVPYEACRQLALRRVMGITDNIPLSSQARDTVRRLVEALPEVAAVLNERAHGIFRDVEPSRWEYRKPDPEEVATYIKMRMHERLRNQARVGFRVREEPGCLEGDEQRVEEWFLKAFRVLMAMGMLMKVRVSLSRLDQGVGAGEGKALLSEIGALNLDEKTIAKIAANLKDLASFLLGDNGGNRQNMTAGEDGLDIEKLTAAVKKEIETQEMKWDETLSIFCDLVQQNNPVAAQSEALKELLIRAGKFP